MKFNFDEFVASDLRNYSIFGKGQRYGQYIMNCLRKYDVYDTIPKHCDCFYDDTKVASLMCYLYEFTLTSA